MTRFKITKAVALLAFVGIAAAQSFAAPTVYLDTIGSGSNYQIGGELTRTMQLGFDTAPMSGDFTGVRPVSKMPDPPGVTLLGTTGVPCAELLIGGVPVTGNFAAWLIQPFTPTQSGYISSVQFIAQWKSSAGYEQGDGRTAYVDIITAPPAGVYSIPGSINPVAVDLSGTTRGTLVTASGLWKQVNAGTTYWIVFSPVDTKGVWNSNGLDYANLNWARKDRVPDSSKVSSALYNNYNGNGDFVVMPNRVLGVKALGYATPPTQTNVGNAKTLPNGTLVQIANIAISGKNGSVPSGYFYIQSPDRSSGIRVQGATAKTVGDLVSVTGTVETLPTGERYIAADSVTDNGSTSSVIPLTMVTKNVGGGTVAPVVGPDGGVGLNNVGLLVKVEGKVNSKSGNVFYVNDDTTGNGVKVQGVAGMPALNNGDFVAVTGVVSLESIGGVKSAIILIRSASDVVKIQ